VVPAAERLRYRGVLLGVTALLAVACASCPRGAPKAAQPMRDIDAVLKDHASELMKVPGVVGVYVGQLDDRKTPCLKVMVVKKTPELARVVPSKLEGYPVVLEESGVIRPMRED
jgi:hypothetical protein